MNFITVRFCYMRVDELQIIALPSLRPKVAALPFVLVKEYVENDVKLLLLLLPDRLRPKMLKLRELCELDFNLIGLLLLLSE